MFVITPLDRKPAGFMPAACKAVVALWVALLALIPAPAHAQSFVKLTGSADVNAPHGSSSRTPGAREGAATWRDTAGNIWLFGGLDAAGTWHSDLWKYDTALNQWVWVRGSQATNQTASYGIQGLAAETNNPPPRQDATTWTDPSGDLWLYGGRGYSGSGDVLLSDLWKFDTSIGLWVWITGNTADLDTAHPAVQGDLGTLGSRQGASGWCDASGDLWLYGGRGFSLGSLVHFTDLWKYDSAAGQWRWMAGSDTPDDGGIFPVTYYTPGSAYYPPARRGAASWMDAQGRLWLMGGTDSNGTRWNDLWNYNPATGLWTWTHGGSIGGPGSGVYGASPSYGTQGQFHGYNRPGGRQQSVTWTDSSGTSGTLWLFGGFGFDGVSSTGILNDLWRFDVALGQWMWVGGSDRSNTTANTLTSYGTQGVAAAGNQPGPRMAMGGAAGETGVFYLFGGRGYTSSGSTAGRLNDLWKYDVATGHWTWLKGTDQIDTSAVGIYGNMQPLPQTLATPGAREGTATWRDGAGNVWLFGGMDAGGTWHSDLWKYDTALHQWVWARGPQETNQIASYGIQGLAAETNNPPPRQDATTWTDPSGDLWLYGGRGYSGSGDVLLSDLWKFDTSIGLWVWITGNTADLDTAHPAVQGDLGTLGSRQGASGWCDASGDLWLYGGRGLSLGSQVHFTDLWKYDSAAGQWRWMAGSDIPDDAGIFPVTYYTPGSAYYPPARRGAASWMDVQGRLWLMGGTDSNGTRWNDLWNYNPATQMWTWTHGGSYGGPGSGVYGASPSYGTQGEFHGYNRPGGRQQSVTWTDSSGTSGTLWLFGGFGFDGVSSTGVLNDLWRFDVALGQWMWVGGSDRSNTTANTLTSYGTQGVAAAGNQPGPRMAMGGAAGETGVFYLFGGRGYTSSGSTAGRLNDLWKYDVATGHWTWLKGTDQIDTSAVGIYGNMQPLPQTLATPGAREGAATWRDGAGNVWLFGGMDAGGTWHSDLWKYDTALDQWVWVRGPQETNQTASYGIQGLAAETNNPPPRQDATTWTDPSGNLWLYGGRGYSGSVDVLLSDLWKFDTSIGLWVWITGSTADLDTAHPAVQGDLGTLGSRQGASGWCDASGDLWLYGGRGLSLGSQVHFTDLWKYDSAAGQWRWMAGSDIPDDAGIFPVTYYTPGSAYYPPARRGAASWMDVHGRLWLMGGTDSNGTRWNDLWNYNPATGMWTWTHGGSYGGPGSGVYGASPSYGTQGEFQSFNRPGGRQQSVTWTDSSGTSGTLWLFGGFGFDGVSSTGVLNDLWRFDVALGQWMWVGGSDRSNTTANTLTSYGTQGVAAAGNQPGPRMAMGGAAGETGVFYLFGGRGYTSSGSTAGRLNDLWKYDVATGHWTWLKGTDQIDTSAAGLYGYSRNASVQTSAPGARYEAATWRDSSGRLWLFGGFGYDSDSAQGYLNDLWKYDPGTGEWKLHENSSRAHQTGIYTAQGVPSTLAAPGSRKGASTWSATSGDLWLFGGVGLTTSTVTGTLNDLWRFDTSAGTWTWMHGSSSLRTPGVHGSPLTGAPANIPGAREQAASWSDASGNLWLFGGRGVDGDATAGHLNDLWKYETQSGHWIWIAGSTGAGEPGIYGTEGSAAPGNTPGARSAAVTWTDSSGQFWLYGGFGHDENGAAGYLSDLWTLSPATGQWTWTGGSKAANQLLAADAEGVAGENLTPGGRSGAAAWLDASGHLWLYGGLGQPPASAPGYLGDFWKYNIALGQWAWMKGSLLPNQPGNHGTGADALPGARRGSAPWTDSTGRFYLFGGQGHAATSHAGLLNDFWNTTEAVPVTLSRIELE